MPIFGLFFHHHPPSFSSSLSPGLHCQTYDTQTHWWDIKQTLLNIKEEIDGGWCWWKKWIVERAASLYTRSLTPCFFMKIIDCGPWWLTSVKVYLNNFLKSFNEPRREASCLLKPLLIAVCLSLIWFPRDLYFKKKSYYKLNTWHARQCFISVLCRCHLDGHYSELNNFLLAVPTIFTGNLNF